MILQLDDVQLVVEREVALGDGNVSFDRKYLSYVDCFRWDGEVNSVEDNVVVDGDVVGSCDVDGSVSGEDEGGEVDEEMDVVGRGQQGMR